AVGPLCCQLFHLLVYLHKCVWFADAVIHARTIATDRIEERWLSPSNVSRKWCMNSQKEGPMATLAQHAIDPRMVPATGINSGREYRARIPAAEYRRLA